MNIAEILEKQTKKYQDKPAVIFREQNITFQQLKDISLKLAVGLQDLGVKRGDKVAIYLPNCLEYIYSCLAVFYCGAIAVPLDFMLTEEELASCISHSEVTVLITKSKPKVSWVNLKEICPHLKNIIFCHQNLDNFLSFEELIRKATNIIPRVLIREEDCALIFYTSGTTGRPKGISVNYFQLGICMRALEHFVDLSDKDIALCAVPFSHIGGFIYILTNIYFGLTVVLMERFIPLEFLKHIQNYRISCFWIVPSMYYAILQLKEFETLDLSSLRWIVSFGASSSSDALRRFHKYCPCAHLLNGWGMTETSPPNTVIPMGSTKIESVGRPAPWIEIKIFDENDKELPTGQIGEIVIKGEGVFDGYYKDPQSTNQAIRNGWFHTGDLGRLDKEGYLYIVGRIKEMIKVAGEIVFEPEIESAIYRHPAVNEVAVIGVVDKLRGEVPKAFIVLKNGSKSNAEELRYFCRKYLAHFKIPRYFEFRDKLPKTSSAKVDKDALRKL